MQNDISIPVNLLSRKKVNTPKRSASSHSASKKTFRSLTGSFTNKTPPTGVYGEKSSSSVSLSAGSSENAGNASSLFHPITSNTVNHIAVWKHATMKGWLTKHNPPAYSFTKNRKQRYIILVDRYLYSFKIEEPTPQFHEFMKLDKDTKVFVTDQFSNVMYCIEIRQSGADSKSWFLQAENVDVMKIWLERLKKTVLCLQAGYTNTITRETLAGIQTENDVLVTGALLERTRSSPSLQEYPQSVLLRHNSKSSNEKAKSPIIPLSVERPISAVTPEHLSMAYSEYTQNFTTNDYSAPLSAPLESHENNDIFPDQSFPHPVQCFSEPQRRQSVYPHRAIQQLPPRPPPPTSTLPPVPRS